MNTPPTNGRNITRDRLIDAAGEIFAEKGLHGATIRDITERAGANIAAVNYHFRDKFELYLVVARQVQEWMEAAVDKPLTAPTPEGRLRERISAMLGVIRDPSRPKWQRKFIGRELFEPSAMEALAVRIERHFSPLTQIVRELRPDLSEQQTSLATSAIAAQVIFHNHHEPLVRLAFPGAPELPLDAILDHIVEFSLAALRGLPAARTPRRPRRAAAPPSKVPRGKMPRTVGRSDNQ